MTRDEFNTIRWGAGMKVILKSVWGQREHTVVSVDLAEALVGLDIYDDPDDLKWLRCESVDLVELEK